MNPIEHAANFDITPWVQLGSFGVLVAFFWHVLKVQLPRLEARADARESIASARQDERDAKHLLMMEKIHADCAQELAAQRKEALEAMAHQRQNFRQEAAAWRESLDRNSAAIAKRNAEDARKNRSGGGEGA